MNYFWVIFNQGEPRSLVADIVDFRGFESWELTAGNAVMDWDESARVTIGPNGRGGPPDDVLQTSAPVPIFSSRLRSALERSGILGIQYLPIRLVGQDAPEKEPFAVANVLNRIKALDVEAAELTRFPGDYFLPARRGTISGLRRPVLRRTSALGKVHVFRLEEYPAPMFVSGHFRDVYRLGRFTGIAFEPVAVIT